MTTLTIFANDETHRQYSVTASNEDAAQRELARMIVAAGVGDYRGPYVVTFEVAECPTCGRCDSHRQLTPLSKVGTIR